MLTSSVNVIIQLLILMTCTLSLLIYYTLKKGSGINISVTGLPLTTLLHLIRNYTHIILLIGVEIDISD